MLLRVSRCNNPTRTWALLGGLCLLAGSLTSRCAPRVMPEQAGLLDGLSVAFFGGSVVFNVTAAALWRGRTPRA